MKINIKLKTKTKTEENIMPYVSITTTKTANDSVKDKLNAEISEIMTTLPGKNKDNTLLAVIDGVKMYKSGLPNDGTFVEVRLFGPSPEDSKKEFAQKLKAILKDTLSLTDNDCIYMNYIENETWG